MARRRDVARGGRASRGEGWGPGGVGRLGGTLEAVWLSRSGGKLAAAAACRAPAELEVEDEFQGLVCKNKKVQGLHYKLKFPTDLGLK